MGRTILTNVKIINQNCDPTQAKDTKLPNSCYLVEYKVEGESCFDLVISSKQVDIFDHYYDQYGKDFVRYTQSEGRVNPKLWVNPSPDSKKKK